MLLRLCLNISVSIVLVRFVFFQLLFTFVSQALFTGSCKFTICALFVNVVTNVAIFGTGNELNYISCPYICCL